MDYLWSVWLLPKGEEKEEYKNFIKIYSDLYSRPLFDPHVTLFGRLNIAPELVYPFFNRISPRYKNLKVDTLTVKNGESPWKTIYIDFYGNKDFMDFQNKIDKKLRVYRDYVFNPHLSLAYGNFMPNKKDLCLISLNKTINFSSIALVNTPDNIEEWYIIKEFQFKKESL